MPKRTFWLVTGAALGAGSSLWAERRIRRTVAEAAARLQPDSIAAEVGRATRNGIERVGERVRDAVATGREEMHLHEEQLWEGLADAGAVPAGREPVTHVAADGTRAASRRIVRGTRFPVPAAQPPRRGR